MRPGQAWTVRLPGSDVDDIREFRARVLWDGGRRPAFRDDDGRFVDHDPLDEYAHHVVATDEGAVVAAIRVVPLDATGGHGVCERLLDTDTVGVLVDRLGVPRDQVWEGSGWAVDPARRHAFLGARVLAAGAALARSLGRTHLFGAAGVRHGQFVRVRQLGYSAVPGTEAMMVLRLVDEVRLVHGATAATAAGFRKLVDDAAGLLGAHTPPPHPAGQRSGHPM